MLELDSLVVHVVVIFRGRCIDTHGCVLGCVGVFGVDGARAARCWRAMASPWSLGTRSERRDSPPLQIVQREVTLCKNCHSARRHSAANAASRRRASSFERRLWGRGCRAGPAGVRGSAPENPC